jgi:hypothetical protein
MAEINTTSNKIRLIFITIFLVNLSGCGGGGGTSTTISMIERSNGTKLNSGTSLTYNSSNANTLAATDEFAYFNATSAASSQNPLEVINAHKAYGYGLTGSGENIAILDSGFYNSHNELNSKTITTYGTVDAATGASVVKDHGLFVASIATGEDDDSGLQGVAPSASLHIADYTNLNGNTYYPTHWANATDNASSSVVQNNSWGIDYQVDTLQSDISSNEWSNDYGIAQKWNSSGYTSNEASATSYITALNNFQDHGVIVYALSNTDSYTDADFQAALPELFSQLKEAWITAVNVEITGASGNETYTRKSAPCGSTASYCLGADGYQVKGAAYSGLGSNYYWTNASGTSFVAPQISGAVALLAEAFPNHTPAQLTDRLLASADNSFFSHSNAVQFGNGVEHGFNSDFGHGIMDIYASLNPITSSSYTRIFTGDSTQDSSSYQPENSRLSTSRSFGDSILNGLKGETGYTYDDLYGGFEYDMSYHINQNYDNNPKFNVSQELLSLEDKTIKLQKNKLNNGLDSTVLMLNDYEIKPIVTIGSSTLPIKQFFELGANSETENLNNIAPYLEHGEGDIGVSSVYNIKDSRVALGMSAPIYDQNNNTIGSKKAISASISFGNPSTNTITLITGMTQDNDALLGTTGSNAFSLDGSKSDTTFAGIKAQSKLINDITLTAISTISSSDMSSPNDSYINYANNIITNSLILELAKSNIFGEDHLSLNLSQPSRINEGNMGIKIASLAKSDGSIKYTNKDINLEPSGRQIDFDLSYIKEYNEDLSLSLKQKLTKNSNHNKYFGIESSSFAGMKYKNITAGMSSNNGFNNNNSEIRYSLNF